MDTYDFLFYNLIQSNLIIKCIPMKVFYFVTVHMYYVGFVNKCSGIIGVNAVGLPVLFEDCAKVIASSGASSYLRGNGGDGTT